MREGGTRFLDRARRGACGAITSTPLQAISAKSRMAARLVAQGRADA
jgi:hypothetical protein